jgi:hypothetical protein
LADHDRDLELEVQGGRSTRGPYGILRPLHRGCVREVEDGDLEPGFGDLETATGAGAAHVLLEGHEVAERMRLRQWRQQPDVGERPRHGPGRRPQPADAPRRSQRPRHLRGDASVAGLDVDDARIGEGAEAGLGRLGAVAKRDVGH